MTYLLDYENSKKNYKLIKTNVSNYQEANTTWSNVNGSQIEYNPNSGSSKVVYEFISSYGFLDDANGLEFKLLIGENIGSVGNVGGANNNNYCASFGGTHSTNVVRFSDIFTLKFLLDISSLSWSSEKTLVLQCRSYNGSNTNKSLINCTTPTADEANDALLYNPLVVCYSV